MVVKSKGILPKMVEKFSLNRFTRWLVSNIFHFHPYLGKIPILTSIFVQLGWFNHQLVKDLFHKLPSAGCWVLLGPGFQPSRNLDLASVILRFSKLAVVDFQLKNLTGGFGWEQGTGYSTWRIIP